MKNLLYLISVLMFISCNNDNIYENGDIRKYTVRHNNVQINTIEFNTKINWEENLVNEWNVEIRNSDCILFKKYITQTDVGLIRTNFMLPTLNDSLFWSYLPNLIFNENLKIGDSLTKTNTKQIIETGKLYEYDFIIENLGKVIYQSEMKLNSVDCNHRKISFKYNNNNFNIDYYFNEKFGLIYCRISVNKNIYTLDLISFTKKNNLIL